MASILVALKPYLNIYKDDAPTTKVLDAFNNCLFALQTFKGKVNTIALGIKLKPSKL